MTDETLRARLAAIEVMLFALAQQLKTSEFVRDLEEQKELAVPACHIPP
jgi:hypothetical protein